MNLKEARAYAQEVNSTLRADHPGFGGSVLVTTDEPCRLFYRWALALALEDSNWTAVFTEHHGFHVFHNEEAVVLELQPAELAAIEDDGETALFMQRIMPL
jgi:hypothetical protein